MLIKLISVVTLLQCFFFISIYQSMKFINLYDGPYLYYEIYGILYIMEYCEKHILLCVKSYLLKILEDVPVGILRSSNFGK